MSLFSAHYASIKCKPHHNRASKKNIYIYKEQTQVKAKAKKSNDNGKQLLCRPRSPKNGVVAMPCMVLCFEIADVLEPCVFSGVREINVRHRQMETSSCILHAAPPETARSRRCCVEQAPDVRDTPVPRRYV